MTYQSCCHCKLTIISVILSGISTFIQILLIYLEQMDKIKNAIWFQLIVAVLNASLGCVNCVQLGIRRNQAANASIIDLSCAEANEATAEANEVKNLSAATTATAIDI